MNVNYRKNFSGTGNLASQLSSILKECYPGKNKQFLENNLKSKNYDVFWITQNSSVQALLMTKEDSNGDVYITHVCKRPSYIAKGVFEVLFSKVKQVYGNKRYLLQVREKTNPQARKAYEKAGFAIRRNLPIKRTKNMANYLVTMNTTKENALKAQIRKITVGTKFSAFGLGGTYAMMAIQVRNELLEITRERWSLHKKKWNKPAGDEPWMHLIYGNLAVTFFVVVNQYLGRSNPSVFSNSEVPYTKVIQIVGNQHNLGINYESSNGTYSGDLFRDGIYNKTFIQLKKMARQVFDDIYQTMLNRETPPQNGTAKDYLLYVNRNFTGRGNVNKMLFYTHNLGMYQFLAMFGYHSNTATLYPYSGNCTIIAIIRISLFERLTQGKFRNQISFVSQSKEVNGQQQVCHYGLRTHNMTPKERYAGGNFQASTHRPFAYLKTMSNISSYTKMYDVLSANSIFRAKRRALRNQRLPSRLQVLEAFSQLIKTEMDYETQQLHNHVLGSTVPITHHPNLNR